MKQLGREQHVCKDWVIVYSFPKLLPQDRLKAVAVYRQYIIQQFLLADSV